jgi:uncharacterized membrane protein
VRKIVSITSTPNLLLLALQLLVLGVVHILRQVDSALLVPDSLKFSLESVDLGLVLL